MAEEASSLSVAVAARMGCVLVRVRRERDRCGGSVVDGIGCGMRVGGSTLLLLVLVLLMPSAFAVFAEGERGRCVSVAADASSDVGIIHSSSAGRVGGGFVGAVVCVCVCVYGRELYEVERNVGCFFFIVCTVQRNAICQWKCKQIVVDCKYY